MHEYGDESLAGAIADIYAGIGIHSHFEIRPSRSVRIGYEFLGDPFWPAHSLDDALVRCLIGQRIELTNCALFISDLALDDPRFVVSIITAAKNRDAASLLLFGRSLSKQCLGLLMANSSPAFPIHVVSTPGTAPINQMGAMDDIATIAGATPFKQVTGAGRASFNQSDLGFCRRAWASRTHFGLFAGQGSSESVRQRVRELRTALRTSGAGKREQELSLRLSRMTARSAILWIDGSTERIVSDRKRLAERTCRVVRSGLIKGVLPGGGIALLECSRAVDSLRSTADEPEEMFALEMLKHGLEAPMRALAHNSGQSPSLAIARARLAAPTKALEHPIAHDPFAKDEEILDSFEVVSAAWHHAVSGVAQALTLGSVVLPRSPGISAAP